MIGLTELLGGGVAVIIAVLAAWFGGRMAGKKDAVTDKKVKDYERVIKNTQDRASADSAASGGDAAKRLRDEWGRD